MRHYSVLTPLCVLSWLGKPDCSGGTFVRFTHHIYMVAALESLLTLLSWLHCAFLTASRPTDCFHATVSIFLLDVSPSPDATLLASDFPVVSSPFAWWYTYHLTFPCTLRKVRDSNSRAISDSLVSSEVLSSTQPTFLLSELANLVL